MATQPVVVSNPNSQTASCMMQQINAWDNFNESSQTSSLKSVLAGVTNSGSLGSVHLSIEVHLKPS